MADFFDQDHIDGSDSDSSLDEDEESPDYYQPISAVDECEDGDLRRNDAVELDSQRLANGFLNLSEGELGMASLSLSDDAEPTDKGEDDDDEEERIREEADSAAAARAFREDEDRRNAPLTAENAVRIMEAMRGVSFGGVAPDWAHRVPESNWIDRLRRLSESTRRD